jgi:hypothetical protein
MASESYFFRLIATSMLFTCGVGAITLKAPTRIYWTIESTNALASVAAITKPHQHVLGPHSCVAEIRREQPNYRLPRLADVANCKRSRWLTKSILRCHPERIQPGLEIRGSVKSDVMGAGNR